MSQVEVFAPGTLVRLNDVTCTVLLVQVDHNGVTGYYVAWWDDRERVEEWVKPHEIERFNADEKPTLSVKYMTE